MAGFYILGILEPILGMYRQRYHRSGSFFTIHITRPSVRMLPPFSRSRSSLLTISRLVPMRWASCATLSSVALSLSAAKCNFPQSCQPPLLITSSMAVNVR